MKNNMNCCIAQCKLYSKKNLLLNLDKTSSVQCTVYRLQCTVYSVQCTVYSVQCTDYSVQCTVYNMYITL